jgi:hypothetical protein
MTMIEPRALLDDFSRSHPGCWQLTAELVQDKGQGLPDWPAWCWLPMAGSYAVTSRAPCIDSGMHGVLDCLVDNLTQII